MVERRQRPEHAGIADHDVELAVALVDREREARDAVRILHVDRYQRGRAADGLDAVVELFEPARGARDSDDMGAGLRQLHGYLRADSTRRAGDKRDAVLERFHTLSLILRRPRHAAVSKDEASW